MSWTTMETRVGQVRGFALIDKQSTSEFGVILLYLDIVLFTWDQIIITKCHFIVFHLCK